MTDRTEIPGIAGRSARRRPLLRVAAAGLVAALLAALAVVGPLGLATASSAQAAEPQPPVGAGQTVRITTGTGKSTTVWGNLTITGAREIGYAEAFPCGKPRATAVNVSIDPGRSVADFAVVGTDEQGAFCVFVSVAAHVVFDQVGTSDLVRAGPPQRVFDTRMAQFGAAMVRSRGTVTVVTGGPANSVSWGTLGIRTPAVGGWAVAYPCDAARPNSSNVNFVAGQAVSAFVGVKTGASGQFCVYSSASAHVVFDQVANSPALPVAPPLRLLDTRLASGGAAPVTNVRVHTGVGTVLGTLTLTGAAGSGWAVAYPCDQQVPTASNINFGVRASIANFVAVRTDANGDFCIKASSPVHVIFDRLGVTNALVVGAPARRADSRTDWSGPSQVITVRSENASDVRAQVALWQRGADGKFTMVRGPINGWVGELGIGEGRWGIPRTPVGFYTIKESFGILSNPGTKLPYFKVDSLDWWDGDTTSPTYNTHVRKTYVPGSGSEHLIDVGYPYYYAAFFNYNPEQIPSKGSAFFFHVSNNEPTGGCVSVPLADIKAMLQYLDPAQQPTITIGLKGWGTWLVDRTLVP